MSLHCITAQTFYALINYHHLSAVCHNSVVPAYIAASFLPKLLASVCVILFSVICTKTVSSFFDFQLFRLPTHQRSQRILFKAALRYVMFMSSSKTNRDVCQDVLHLLLMTQNSSVHKIFLWTIFWTGLHLASF